MSSQSKVCFFFDEVKLSLTKREDLKAFIIQIFRKEGKKLDSLNYVFCSDKTLLRINQEWLSHDNYTDIIANFLDNLLSGSVRLAKFKEIPSL